MKKKGQFDTIIPWFIMILVLVVGLGIYLVLSGKLGSMLDYLKDLLRFG